jgi:adenylate cyclase
MAWTVGFVAICGAVIGFFVIYALGFRPYLLGIIQGAFTGTFIAIFITLYSTIYPNTPQGQWLKHLSFNKSILLGSILYLFIILVGIRVGVWIFYRLPVAEFNWLSLETIISVIISVVLAIAINATQQINRMLGQGVLRNFITGAYHHPRKETRVFLFIDVVGSTGIAETIGAIKYHALLDRFFYDLTDAILSHKGEIHKYVGDEIIISWPLGDTGKTPSPKAIDCYFAIQKKIASRQNRYLDHFGFAPSFRGAIHAGTVVTGEMGDIKREIVFLGDTVNTTARIMGTASDMDRELLISSRALAILDVPQGIDIHPLGPTTLRGRKETVDLSALTLSAQAGL